MLVDKEKLKKKLLNDFSSDKKICSICRQVITKYHIKDNDFEYVKNKLRRKLRT